MIDTPGDDDEVHILTDSDRMVAYIPHEEENSSIGVTSSTLVTQSEDGITWTDPLQAYEEGFSFWKPVSRAGAHYVAADTAAGGGRVDLLAWASTDEVVEGGARILPGSRVELILEGERTQRSLRGQVRSVSITAMALNGEVRYRTSIRLVSPADVPGG